ncbi:MAG: ribosome biogenesis GTPase Der [Gammaproteobacteria bacterium]|nr:ribosome biogenesis GTPase Der [Gammaproteobacteria bacterium]
MPTLALVGRPNVGKSTLFNKLTHRRDALVADVPGLTRDRRYGRAHIDQHLVTLIDTGGLRGEFSELTPALEQQAEFALEEADGVLFMVDARDGLTAADQEIADRIRKLGKPVLLIANKMDGVDHNEAIADFSTLGFADSLYISAIHLRDLAPFTEWLDKTPLTETTDSEGADEDPDAIRVAIIGRPNVGKSTLTNRLLGEQRQLVFDAPGTTRDSIAVPFTKEGKSFLLIDTAGVRRKGRVEGVAEKFSVVKALQAIEEAHVVILVMDAREGVVDQDLHLVSYAVEAGAGVLVALNKWDGLSSYEKATANTMLDRKLNFAPWIPVLHISALHGSGVGLLLKEIESIFTAGAFDFSTTFLTKLLIGFVEAHAPPAVRGRAVKLRFAHKAGAHPPRIVIHGNQTKSVPASYMRYLENGYRQACRLVGNPVHIVLKTGENPYAGKKNPLTRRQRLRRKRVMRHKGR